MRVGTFNLHSVAPWTNSTDVVQQQFEQMVEADRVGLNSVWLAEHNARSYGFVGNTVNLATALAAATSRIRIATAVSRLPLHHPLHLAEDLAYADILSGGRIDFGVGKGYDHVEFGSYGVDFASREARWQETLDAVRQIWATGRTKFEGKFYNLNDGELLPKPLQVPSPPTYVMVSGSERSMDWAAKHLLPIASGSGPTAPELRVRLSKYADIASSAGYSDESIREVLGNCWQLKPLHVGQTTDRAIAEYRRGLEWYMETLLNRRMFGFETGADTKPAAGNEVMPGIRSTSFIVHNADEPRDYDYFVKHKSVILGSPEKVINDLGEYCYASGIGNVICWVNMGCQPHPQVMNSLRRLGEEVLPKLRNVWPAPLDWQSPAMAQRI